MKIKARYLSRDTQAIKMFSQNKTPINVATELDLKVDEVERIYKDYWKLKRLYKLYNVYEEHIKKNIPSFLKLYKIIKEEELSEKDIRTIIIYAFQLQSLDELVQGRKDELKFLVNQNKTLISKIKELEDKSKQFKNIYNKNHFEVDRLDHTIKIKYTYLNTLENSINDLKNGDGFSKILEITHQK
jgi:hypothetical protein